MFEQKPSEFNPKASKNSFKIHKEFLRKLVKDDRMQPSRRLLAEMLLLFLEGYIDMELLYLAFGAGANKVKWNKGSENPDHQATTKLDLEATNDVKKAYQELQQIIGGISGNTADSATDNGSGS